MSGQYTNTHIFFSQLDIFSLWQKKIMCQEKKPFREEKKIVAASKK